MEEENYKETNILLAILLTILIALNSLAILFIIGVSKVQAITFTYNGNDTSAYELTGLLPISRGYFRGCTNSTSCYSTSYGSWNQYGKVRNTTNVANDSKGMMYYVIPTDITIYNQHYYSVEALYCGPSRGNPTLYMWTGNGYASSSDITIGDNRYETYKQIDNIEYNADGSNFMGCTMMYNLFKAEKAGAVIGLQVRNTGTTTSSTFHYLIGYKIEEISPTDYASASALASGITTIQNAINSSTTTINSNTNAKYQTLYNLIIQQQQETQQAIQESTEQQTEEIMGDDMTEQEKAQADNTQVENYEEAEETLKNAIDINSLNSMHLDLDFNSNNWIWNTMTTMINSNTLIYTMIISILSVGVIKLVFAR